MMPTSVDMLAAFKSWSISGVLVVGEPLVDRSPHSFQMAACECMMWKAYLVSVYKQKKSQCAWTLFVPDGV